MRTLISHRKIIKVNGFTMNELNAARNNRHLFAYHNARYMQREHYIHGPQPVHISAPLTKLVKEYEARKLTLLHTDTDAILYKEIKNE